jgi:branched-chain amino acid transport system ATP-binding protein
MVEQNARLALRASDRAYVLASGSVVLEGRAADLLENEAVRKAYLGG